jgi:hypothetical protein
MREASVVFLATASAAFALACSSSNTSSATDGGGNDTGSSTSSGGGSGSSGGGSSGGGGFDAALPMGMQIGTPPTPMDGGVYCPISGAMGPIGMATPAACASPDICCWGDQSQFPPPLAGCTTASACTGSSIACSNTAQCGAGQVCCFVFAADAGGGGAGMGPFTAQCAAACPEGDMVHYQLCGSDSDCASGETCMTMAPYSPYCAGAMGVDGGTGGEAAADGGG